MLFRSYRADVSYNKLRAKHIRLDARGQDADGALLLVDLVVPARAQPLGDLGELDALVKALYKAGEKVISGKNNDIMETQVQKVH